jgi:hypothetical protein
MGQLHAGWTAAYRIAADTGDRKMFDVLMIVAGLAFFAVTIAYVAACDKL